MNLQKSSRTGTRQDLMKMIMTMMMRITLALTLTRMEENEYDEEKNLAISLFFCIKFSRFFLIAKIHCSTILQ